MSTTQHFRYAQQADGTVVMHTRDHNDHWQVCCKFVETGEDGERTAFPGPSLRELTTGSGTVEDADADLVAYRHMVAWQDACAQWGREHPGERLPLHLLEESTIPDDTEEIIMSTTTDTTTALALADAFDRHYIAGTRPALPAALAELGLLLRSDGAVAAELLTHGAELQYARDHGLDELAQLALVLPLDAVRADRLAAYARITQAHVAEWAPEVAAAGETTVAALTEMLAYVTRDYGTLTDYRTGEQVRPATAAEHARSLAAGETGAFELDGRSVFVAGGPEES
jgi:hypothetical protein